MRKMHYGHFTLYSKTIVWKSDNIYLAENIVATGYVRGNDTSFNTLDSLYTASGESTARSIYCAMVPVSTRTTEDTVQSGVGYFNPMDITGHFAQSVPHLRNLDLEVGNPGREHYPGASFYASVWRMNNTSAKLDGDYTPLQLGAHNTLCFQVRGLRPLEPPPRLTRFAGTPVFVQPRVQGVRFGHAQHGALWVAHLSGMRAGAADGERQVLDAGQLHICVWGAEPDGDARSIGTIVSRLLSLSLIHISEPTRPY